MAGFHSGTAHASGVRMLFWQKEQTADRAESGMRKNGRNRYPEAKGGGKQSTAGAAVPGEGANRSSPGKSAAGITETEGKAKGGREGQ